MLISLVFARNASIILAGDPQQLGPVIMSPFARKSGLGCSLLERLMNSPPYTSSERGYDPLFITKLTRNFRSHHRLLEMPSKLFYGGELIPSANPKDVEPTNEKIDKLILCRNLKDILALFPELTYEESENPVTCDLCYLKQSNKG